MNHNPPVTYRTIIRCARFCVTRNIEMNLSFGVIVASAMLIRWPHDVCHFFSGSVDGSCSNFLPAFSFTIVSAAFRLSCVRNASVAPRTVHVRLPPPLRSLTHIRMKVPITSMRRTRTNTNVRRSFTICNHSEQ